MSKRNHFHPKPQPQPVAEVATEETVVEETPVTEPEAEVETPVEETPAVEPTETTEEQEQPQEPTEETPAEQEPAEEAPVEEPKAEEPKKPVSGFKSVHERLEQQRTETPVVVTSNAMHDALKAKLGIDIDAEDEGSFIRTLVADLDGYVEDMNPRAPVTPAQSLQHQTLLVRRINDALLQPTEIGVPALQVVEEYFRQHSRGALGGIYPFRSFNELPPRLQKYQDIIYAIQLIALNGKAEAMKMVSIARLKEACPTPESQLVLLGYLNA